MFARFWFGAAGLDLFQGLTATSEFGNDRIHRSRPDKWPWILIPGGEKLSDSSFEIRDAEERVPADAFVGQFGEPALDEVQPAAAGGHVVDNKARMLAEPRFNVGVPVGAVVVHDEVQSGLTGKLAMNAPKKS